MNISNSSNLPASTFTEDLIAAGVWISLLLYALVLNVLTVLGVCRERRMRRTTSYWFVLSLCACDLLMVVISLVHIVPATLFHNRFVHTDDFRNGFAIFVYDVVWYSGVIQLGGMAINRYVSIVHSCHYELLFSRQNTLLFLAFLYFMGVCVSAPALLPCCWTIYDHNEWLTYYVDSDSFYSYIDLAVNSTSLLVMIFCYTAILWRVRTSHLNARRHAKHSKSAESSSRTGTAESTENVRHPPNRREMRLFVQFFVVSAVFLVTFLTWQALFKANSSRWLNFTVTTFFFVNNGVNPTVYMIFNSGLRRQISAIVCGCCADLSVGGSQPGERRKRTKPAKPSSCSDNPQPSSAGNVAEKLAASNPHDCIVVLQENDQEAKVSLLSKRRT